MKKHYQITELIMLVLLSSLIVLFFPSKWQEGYTCLADRMLSGDLMNFECVHTPDAMIHRYVIPFGLIWWGSILSFAMILMHRNKKNKDDHEESESFGL